MEFNEPKSTISVMKVRPNDKIKINNKNKDEVFLNFIENQPINNLTRYDFVALFIMEKGPIFPGIIGPHAYILYGERLKDN